MLFLLPGAEVGHHLIDTAGAEASAEGEDDGAVTGTQLGADGVPLPCLLEHFRPHRVAHDLRLFQGAQLSTAAGTAANTMSTSGASGLLVTPGKAFCS